MGTITKRHIIDKKEKTNKYISSNQNQIRLNYGYN